jgi:hypothetical protein
MVMLLVYTEEMSRTNKYQFYTITSFNSYNSFCRLILGTSFCRWGNLHSEKVGSFIKPIRKQVSHSSKSDMTDFRSLLFL